MPTASGSIEAGRETEMGKTFLREGETREMGFHQSRCSISETTCKPYKKECHRIGPN